MKSKWRRKAAEEHEQTHHTSISTCYIATQVIIIAAVVEWRTLFYTNTLCTTINNNFPAKSFHVG